MKKMIMSLITVVFVIGGYFSPILASTCAEFSINIDIPKYGNIDLLEVGFGDEAFEGKIMVQPEGSITTPWYYLPVTEENSLFEARLYNVLGIPAMVELWWLPDVKFAFDLDDGKKISDIFVGGGTKLNIKLPNDITEGWFGFYPRDRDENLNIIVKDVRLERTSNPVPTPIPPAAFLLGSGLLGLLGLKKRIYS